jgi:hypothetical protein
VTATNTAGQIVWDNNAIPYPIPSTCRSSGADGTLRKGWSTTDIYAWYQDDCPSNGSSCTERQVPSGQYLNLIAFNGAGGRGAWTGVKVQPTTVTITTTALGSAPTSGGLHPAFGASRTYRAEKSADPPPSANDPHFVSAHLDATALLELVPLPPGAEALSGAPSSAPALDGPPETPGSPYLIDKAAWWNAPGTMDEAIAWFKGHAPFEGTMPSSGVAGDRSGVQWEATGWYFPTLDQTVTLRELAVMVAPDGPAPVAIRADAQVIWDPLRAPSSLISASEVRSVTVMQLAGFGGNTATSTTLAPSVTSSAPALVDRFVSLVNGLPVDDSPDMNCPDWTGLVFEVEFVDAAGSLVATLHGDQSACGGYSLVVDGENQTPLDDPQQPLFDLVSSTLHISLPPTGE